MNLTNTIQILFKFSFKFKENIYQTKQKIDYNFKTGWKRADNAIGPFEHGAIK